MFRQFQILKDRYTRNAFAASALIFVLGGVIAYSFLRNVRHLLIVSFPPAVPVFLGTKATVFYMLGVGFFVVLINFFLSNMLYKRARIFSHLLSFSSIFFSVLIFIAATAIISAN